jgi:hypothetical protein
MGNPNSHNNYNDGAVTNFITQVNSGVAANVVSCFCADASTYGPATIGIANHGPNYSGQGAITTLFQRLFTSFQNLTLTEEKKYAPRLYSLDKATLPTISAIMSITGSFVSPWFPKVQGTPDSTSHYSKPLSDINPQTSSPTVLKGKGIPVAAIFSFDTTNANNPSIARLWLYLDRYRFESDLRPVSDGSNVYREVGRRATGSITAKPKK